MAMRLWMLIAGLEAEGWRIVSCNDHSVLADFVSRRRRFFLD
jgi:hypothetical protein